MQGASFLADWVRLEARGKRLCFQLVERSMSLERGWGDLLVRTFRRAMCHQPCIVSCKTKKGV